VHPVGARRVTSANNNANKPTAVPCLASADSNTFPILLAIHFRPNQSHDDEGTPSKQVDPKRTRCKRIVSMRSYLRSAKQNKADEAVTVDSENTY
jgi:hypothetical protein